MLTATHINYYHICKRKLWLFANGITMEHTSEAVAEGKLLHESAYPQRAERYSEITIGGSKIDFYDAHAKIIHEMKKSDSMELAHEWQIRYYIWLLESAGIGGVTGILEYPKLRATKEINLTGEDRVELQAAVGDIERIIANPSCPPLIQKKFCRSCSYFDFCWSGE